MASNFTVVYDACVLYPFYLRDVLMHLAMSDICRAKWTDLIQDEWIRNVLKNNPELTVEKFAKTKELMNSHVRDCLVTEFEWLIPTLTLPDPDDRHVLAAAIVCKANQIITFNIKDFPQDVLDKHDIEALHPDDFIANLVDLNPIKAFNAIEKARQLLKKSPKNFDEYLDILLNQELPISVSLLRQLQSEI